ncbi:liprin-alpha-2-like isoform X1 [Schistocerca americana]|uniref:liprin-alpha-2-like isoform X1 n=1 Tax=Schistocerca americana TaxID=7009 RepID=UPI001F501DE9|nr:liprin-alpha-2-like isoform X1 [Schistocerca americana]
MWNMMCDVMPTISEDSISQRSSQFSGEDANFEQLMVSMLDERDKLMDSLREAQERLCETEAKLQEVEKERDSLQRQISANLPQVRKWNVLTATLVLTAIEDLPCAVRALFI